MPQIRYIFGSKLNPSTGFSGESILRAILYSFNRFQPVVGWKIFSVLFKITCISFHILDQLYQNRSQNFGRPKEGFTEGDSQGNIQQEHGKTQR